MAKDSKQKATLKANKELILRALTEPKFRKLLQSDPEQALGVKKITAVQRKEIALVLATVKGIDQQIGHMADELLCNNGGGCSVVV